MSTIATDDLIGCYVLPKSASDDPDVVHRHEGVVWAVSGSMSSRTGGEDTTLLRVVRYSRGQIRHSVITITEVGSASPPNRAHLRSLIRALFQRGAEMPGSIGEEHAVVLECIRALLPVAS